MSAYEENRSQSGATITTIEHQQDGSNIIASNANNPTNSSSSPDGPKGNWAPPRANTGVVSQFARVDANEPLLDGFILLRLAQLLNIDVYYIGLQHKPQPVQSPQQRQHSDGSPGLSESRQFLVDDETTGGGANKSWGPFGAGGSSASGGSKGAGDGDPGEHGTGVGSGGEFTELPMLAIRPYPKTVGCQIEFNDTNNNNNVNSQQTIETLGQQQQRLQQIDRKNLMDELAEINPFHGYIQRNRLLAGLLRVMRIGLSLTAIMISVDKTISTILLCLISRPDIKVRPGNIGLAYETSDVSMSWLVLILLNISSMYILLSTVFNGHLLWQLLSQRLFLVGRTFQYKTMLSMFVFIYLEYLINISFTSNLFGWSFETNDNDIASDGPGGARWHKGAGGGSAGAAGTKVAGSNLHGNILNSYSVLSNIKTFVTEKDDANLALDVILTIFQFARGIIRMGPYITINYVTICLNEHIKTIRNQTLLTESLKRKQKLKMVVKSKRAKMIRGGGGAGSSAGASPASGARRWRQTGNRSGTPSSGVGGTLSPTFGHYQSTTTTLTTTNMTQQAQAVGEGAARKKRVIFVTEASANSQQQLDNSSLRPPQSSGLLMSNGLPAPRTPSPLSAISSSNSFASLEQASDRQSAGSPAGYPAHGGASSSMMTAIISSPEEQHIPASRRVYLDRIKNFNELEAYITNLYIFTGRLNRLMSRQGLALFFIVHNLVITTTLIVPEAISGGNLMVHFVRVLVVLIGIVPFIAGQALDGQLEQLSKQIDRIIIKQQFINRKRDNLVRIRELLHDIRVNCGGMLDFNIETGIKYLVVAFATAFFIEQEDYKLTRRH